MEFAWKMTVIPSTIIGVQKKNQHPPGPEAASRVVGLMKSIIKEQRGIVILPINVESAHWICLVINYMTKEFVQFDSLQDRLNYKIMSFIQKQYLSPLMRERTDGKPSEFALFKEIKDERYIQQDGYSCGIFVTMFAEAYLRGYSLESSPAKTSKAELEKKRLQYFTGILRHQE
jgi:Ulp1 family protease